MEDFEKYECKGNDSCDNQCCYTCDLFKTCPNSCPLKPTNCRKSIEVED